jgi:Holliday junction resolvase RusA-like endonuclease
MVAASGAPDVAQAEAVVISVVYCGPVVGVNRQKGYSRKLGRAYPNPAYQAFIDALAWMIKAAAKRQTFDGLVEVHGHLILPRGMDHDALTKPICDAIERSGVITNDWWIKGSHFERVGVCLRGREPRVELRITEVSLDSAAPCVIAPAKECRDSRHG